MEKRKMNRVAIGFIILVVMVLVLMFSNSLRRSSRITLPAENSTSGQTDPDASAGEDALTVIAVTPETVQTAIATLARPEQYSRAIRVEQVWSGGSGSFETTVTVSGRWTRTDRTLSDGQVRHTITDGETTYRSPRTTSRPSPPTRRSWSCRWRTSPPRTTAASPM